MIVVPIIAILLVLVLMDIGLKFKEDWMFTVVCLFFTNFIKYSFILS
jgi:hypothetical protein